MSDSRVIDEVERSRFELLVDEDLAGFLEYSREGDTWVLHHTEIFDAFGGRGLGSVLVHSALDQIATHGGHVIPACPFVPRVIEKNPEFLDLVPIGARKLYGL